MMSEAAIVLSVVPTSCLSGDDGSTCIAITSNNVEIVASRDSSIDSKARGSNKVTLTPTDTHTHTHTLEFTCIHNAFIQSDFQERALQKCIGH